MPLSREDYIVILRNLQNRLSNDAPEIYDAVYGSFDQNDDPREAVLEFLDVLISAVSERSSSGNERILELINDYVQTEEGRPIEGIRVELSQQEQEIYQSENIDLNKMPDQSEFIQDLQRLYNAVLEDEGYRGDNQS